MFYFIFRIFLFSYLLIYSLQIVAGNNYKLFSSKGKQVTNYNEISALIESGKIKTGDTLEMSGGKKFTIKHYLGAGNLCFVFSFEDSLGEERAIRIPKYSGVIPGKGSDTYLKELKNYYSTFQTLNRIEQFPAVKIYPSESVSDEYIIQDKLPIQFTYKDYYNYMEEKSNSKTPTKDLLLSESDIKIINDRLLDFAKKSALVTSISDLHRDQVVYTGKEWIVLDGSEPVIEFRYDQTPDSTEDIFQNLIDWDSPFGEDYEDEIKITITKTRDKWQREIKRYSDCKIHNRSLRGSFNNIENITNSLIDNSKNQEITK